MAEWQKWFAFGAWLAGIPLFTLGLLIGEWIANRGNNRA